MKARYVVAIILGATLLFFISTGCRNEVPPSRPIGPFGPDYTWTGMPTTYTAAATIARGTVRFVMDWGDLVDTTEASYASGETASITHVWTSPGTMSVKVQAINSAAPGKTSLWSWPESVDVILDSVPMIDTVEVPPVAMRGVEVDVTVRASDRDGDSIRVHVDWGDGQDTTSEYHHGPYYFGFYPTHTFTQVGTALMVVTAQDLRGAISLPETVLVRVDTTGGVIWSYAAPWTSPLVVNDGVEDCVYFMPRSSGSPGSTPFLVLTKVGSYKYTTPSGSSPYAGVAYCAATQHIVGGGLGVCALDRQLRVAWRCETPESSGWGEPAVSGDRIYLGNDNDTLYCFIDSVDHGVRAAAFATSLSINGAPVIDAQGNVYFGTDSGFLYKVGPGLDTMFWRTRFVAGKVYSPIVGSDGTIFCASDGSCIYAVDPATGTPRWTATVLGVPRPLALGRSAIFVATGGGTAYSIDPATGGVNWSKRLTADGGISSAPAVAADGYVYLLSDNDVLYRMSQADGTVAWECDCSYSGSGAGVSYPRKWTSLTYYPPNSTILPNGNIIVAGSYELYCVAGNPAGPLDPLAPWPKWQRDLYNTGYVGGGR